MLPPLPFISMSNWDNEPLPKREWAVPNRIPLRQTAIISGEGGAGKSNTTLHLCCAHSLGREWLKSMPEPGPAIFLDAEDDEKELHLRTADIAKHYGVTFDDLIKGGLHLLSFAGKDVVLATVARSGKVEPTPLYQQILDACRRHQAENVRHRLKRQCVRWQRE
jgi:RecA-family ATPase